MKLFYRKAEDGQNKDGKQEDEEMQLGVFDTYAILFKILCLKPMIIMVVVLLTAKVKNILKNQIKFKDYSRLTFYD